MIEQPFYYKDLIDHARLQELIDTPICLDESICELEDALRAIRFQSAKTFCIKPGRVGGISTSMEIIKAAKEAGIKTWIGGMLESEIGTAVNIELASQCDDTYAHDLPSTGTYYTTSLAKEKLLQNDGRYELSKDAFTQIDVNLDEVHKQVISHQIFTG